jgi:hypothetical protein
VSLVQFGSILDRAEHQRTVFAAVVVVTMIAAGPSTRA